MEKLIELIEKIADENLGIWVFTYMRKNRWQAEFTVEDPITKKVAIIHQNQSS